MTVIEQIPETGGPDSISIEFRGQAYQTLLKLRRAMREVKSETDVVARAIALLARAQGKEIHLVDPDTGDIEIVSLWR